MFLGPTRQAIGAAGAAGALMVQVCLRCFSPRITRSCGKGTRGRFWVRCSTCKKHFPAAAPPPYHGRDVCRNLFRLASDCRLENAETKAQTLFAEAVCAGIPVETMEETIAISEGERAQLEFLADHGIVPKLAIETHLVFREAVLEHFRKLVSQKEELRMRYFTPRCPWCKETFPNWQWARFHVKHCACAPRPRGREARKRRLRSAA